MEISSREDLSLNQKELERLVSILEKQLKSSGSGWKKYELVINEYVTQPLVDEIVRMYKLAGWKEVSYDRKSYNGLFNFTFQIIFTLS